MSFEGQGVLAAVTTPLDAANRVDVALLAQHSADLLRRGLHGITLFGTTGEGQSFTVAERSAALEGLLGRGIGSGDLVVGAGAAALGDAISLTRHALAQGCRRVLLLPPFYFKDVSSAGVVESIGQVIDAAGDPRLARHPLSHSSGVRSEFRRPGDRDTASALRERDRRHQGQQREPRSFARADPQSSRPKGLCGRRGHDWTRAGSGRCRIDLRACQHRARAGSCVLRQRTGPRLRRAKGSAAGRGRSALCAASQGMGRRLPGQRRMAPRTRAAHGH